MNNFPKTSCKHISRGMSLLRKSSLNVSAAPAVLPQVSVKGSRQFATRMESKTNYRTNNKINNPNPSKNLRRRVPDDAAFHYSSPRLNAVRNSSLHNKRPAIGPPHPNDHGKLTLVLDVDETLIHSRLAATQNRFRQSEERKENANSCEEFQITLEDGETVWVNKRPGLDEFLHEVSQKYETVAYTAGLEEYAKPLLDWLDPKGKIFRHRLYILKMYRLT